MKLSCIFLATANIEWLIEKGIPLLKQNTRLSGNEYEIIIIYNGFKEYQKHHINQLKQYRFFISDTLWVAKGYNLGAQYAQGEYLAFFHDDSMVTSPYWLDIVFDEFKNDPDLTAISSEYGNIDLSPFGLKNFNFLKCTPLIIKKSMFLEAGIFDENYLFGFEDIDFSFNLEYKGYKIKKVYFDYEHKKGSSSVLIFGNIKDFYKEFNFINLNVVNAKYFAKKYNLPFHVQLTNEEKNQLPDLEILNNNKKDFAELIMANYYINKNKLAIARDLLGNLSIRYCNNILFKKIKEKLI